ncbi:penicillin-binding protein [Streptomyces seoulensis]|uniref:Penicillin-binding protein n=1 Tax=Streptomyces seoulensis TaxID=73044 RepID=A0A4P6TR76_STRSO|nr:penicillin-binding transpeptidase domain-containing protein [Streptomyces seoulensis]QBJ89073.1 penicillin-binding protein [Streptomyces seoulensis]
MNKPMKVTLSGMCAALLVFGGIGVYNIVHGLSAGSSDSDGSRPLAAGVSNTPPSDADAASRTRAFLADWSARHVDAAAGGTDVPDAAARALRDYAKGLDLEKVSFGNIAPAGPSAVTPGATKVTFDVTAQVKGWTWHYSSAVAVLKNTNGALAIHWNKSVLYPGLGEDQTLSAGAVPASDVPAKVVASDGKTDLSTFPSLRDIATTISKNAKPTGDSAGTGITVRDSDGSVSETVKVFSKGRSAVVRTTIDAGIQSVAEKAVKDASLQSKPAGTVALDWRNGHILGIAYTGDDGNIAINGIKSPGSTMKIVTSAALFDQAGLNASSSAPCADAVTANSQTFHNDPGVRPNLDASLLQAFAVSCNTSFIKDGFNYLVHDGDASALHDEAVNVFGMGNWSIGGGVATTDPSIPADVQGGDQAAQFIGQGKVTATPLFMASVAATVRGAGFRQPVILADQRQVAAPRPISARTAGYLQSMMRTTATSGTAAPRLSGLAGVGAKTGTAEEGDHTNGWLTAYNSHIAVAALVEGGSSGVDSAGHVVRRLLTGS